MNVEALNQVSQFESTFAHPFPFQKGTRAKTGLAKLSKLSIVQQPTSIHALKTLASLLDTIVFGLNGKTKHLAMAMQAIKYGT